VSHANIAPNNAFLVADCIGVIEYGARCARRCWETPVTIAATLQRLRASLIKSAGTVVFGMEDGTVSIFGLIFGVAATTTSTRTVVIAGASGAGRPRYR
jgi:hypothetical protein